MSGPSSASRRLIREAPRVGDYRRGARLRTTPAGTWFPATTPGDEPAGLLLVHPGVDTRVLVPTMQRLAELNLPGVLTPNPELIQQAGRNWLVTGAPPVPTLADVLGGDGGHRTPSNAAALLSDLAATLLTTHRSGLAHGALDARSTLVGPDGAAQLTDWGTNPSAAAAGDVTAWAALAELLAEEWCAEDVTSAAALARAVQAAAGPTGLAGGFDQLRQLAHTAGRASLAAIAKDHLDAVLRGEVRPGRSARTSQTEPAPPAPAPSEPPPAPSAPAPAHAAPPPAAWVGGQPPPAPSAPWASAPPESSRGGRRPGGKREEGKKGEVPRWQLVLLAALTAITVVAATADLLLLVTKDDTEQSALRIQSVVLWAQPNGPTCTLLGVITTNGESGTVTYGWTGDTESGSAVSATVSSDQTQLEVSRAWTQASSHALDPLVTLQVLRPEPRQASVQPALDCGR